MQSRTVPDIVVGRLPIYLRALTFMQQDGREITSSQELAERLGITSAQIRKDLSHFGEFGKQGTGYHITYLVGQLKVILKLKHDWPVALVGAGDLGRALARYGGFAPKGFRVAAVFDNNPKKIGARIGELEILDAARLSKVVRGMAIRVAIIAVPAQAAQSVANQLVEAGVGAILSYAPITVSVPSGVRLQYVDPVVQLQRMTFYLEE